MLSAHVGPGPTPNVGPCFYGFGDVGPCFVGPCVFGHGLGRQPQGEREEVEGGGRRGGWQKVRERKEGRGKGGNRGRGEKQEKRIGDSKFETSGII